MANQPRKNSGAQRSAPRPSKKTLPDRAPVEPSSLWAIGIFALVTLIFFAKHLFGSAFLWEDFVEFTFPNEVFAARSFMGGVVPFWNPFTFNGMPFLADLQIGYFYPGNIVMYILSGGELSAWLGQTIIVLHYFIAMIGMWKLAKAFGIGGWGAIFAGVSYALCGMMVAHMIHPNMIEHLAWFPLITYLFYRGVTERSWLHALLSGITLGVALLSGHPQSALYMVLFLFALTLFVVVRELRSDDDGARGSIVTALLAAALPIAVGVGIFAIQLLPSQELAGLSERSEISYQKSLEGALGGGQLLTLIVPKFFGVAGADTPRELPFWYRSEPYYFWETVIYIGVVTLLLAVIGLSSRRLGALGWFLGGMGLLGLLYALGDNFIVHPMLGRLPLFSSFRIPTRMAIYLSFGGALLAGAGLERIVRGDTDDDRMSKVTLITGGIIALLAILTLSGMMTSLFNAAGEITTNLQVDASVAQQIADGLGSSAVAPFLLTLLTAIVAWASLKRKIPATAAAALLILFCAVDLYVFSIGQNDSKQNPEDIYKGNDVQFAVFKAAPPDSLFRVKMRDKRMLMQRNQGQYSGIMLYEGYNPLLLARRVPPAATPEKSYDLLNIAYDVRDDMMTGRAETIRRTTQYPHARMLYDARVATPESSMEMMKGSDIDFGRTVVLEEDPGIKLDGTGSGQAKITHYDASRIDVSVTTDKPGILLLSEIWYPAWHVTIDGAEAKLLRADYSLRGVAVPAGNHTVSLTFDSSAYSTGKWVTIATSLLALAGVVLLVMRRRKEGPPREEAPREEA